VLAVYTTAIFVSALLLFLVQPMVGRMVLPVLGGTPAVWNTCMVFFQTLLLVGYLYAHLLTTYLKPRAQAVVHGVVVLAPLLTLPMVLRKDVEAPASEFPVVWLLGTLGALAAAPFLVLSTTGPLLQRWFSGTDHPRARDPYFLYAASNAGSLLALLGYPVLAEPLLRLHEQSQAWAWGYGALAVLVIACAVLRVRRGAAVEAASALGAGEPATPGGGPEVVRPSRAAAWRSRLTWLVLAFAPSSLMIGATTHITTDLAPVPLLWIVPLSIYLVTMIVAYSRFGGAATRWATILLAPTVLALTLLMQLGREVFPPLHLPLHLATLAVGAMACHGRLAAMRPEPRRLTEYFLVMSLGGALGGVFNAIVAPLVFDRVLEYPIAMIVACGAGLATAGKEFWTGPWVPEWARDVFPPPAWAVALMLGGLLLATSLTATIFGGLVNWQVATIKLIVPCACAAGLIIAGLSERAETQRWRRAVLLVAMPLGVASLFFSIEFARGVLEMGGRRLGVALQIGVVGLLCLALIAWAWRFSLAIGFLLMLVAFSRGGSENLMHIERSFFGVSRVQEMKGGGGVELLHGTTLHGLRLTVPGKEHLPTTYYHPTGPAGEVFDLLNRVGRVRSAGIIGMGTGTLAAFSKEGQSFTFFEIDPSIVRLAQNPQYFTWLRDAKGRVSIEVGDGRLKMERSSERFDIIVIDAFSSDSIPIHLITKEAMSVYAEHLNPRGVVLIHTSNRHLKLAGVVAGSAGELGLAVRWKTDVATPEQALEAKAPSEWLIVARHESDLAFLSGDKDWKGPDEIAKVTRLLVWTDDFSNVLGVYAGP